MVQCLNTIYVFAWGAGRVVGKCIHDPAASAYPKVTRLPHLMRNGGHMALANYRNRRIYLSGGREGEEGKGVFFFDLKLWQWSEAPILNISRKNHASTCNRKSVFVFGGESSDGSIEQLQVDGGKEWTIIVP